jgi:hypothetical protein
MLDAKSLFSESYYQAEYPAVASAVASGAFSSGFDHFNKFGKFEGRDPIPFYDDSYYLSQYPGVADAVRTGAMSSGFDHFILYGQKEGRNSSVLYDNTYYLSHNADVAAAVKSSTDPLTGQPLTGIEQYVKTGLSEGRVGSIQFDPKYYLENSPGLKATGFNNQQAAEHFSSYGIDEGRRASSAFDVNYYIDKSQDLKDAGFTYEQAFQHYLTTGFKEFRRTRSGIVPAGSTGGNILEGIHYTSSTFPKILDVFNPRLTVDVTGEGPIFTSPIVTGRAGTGFPFDPSNAENPNPPWTEDNTDTFLTVNNNTNYAITKVVYGNANPTTDLNYKLSDITNTMSDLFGSVSYNPIANTITFDSAGKPGILPGQSWNLLFSFTVPEDLLNDGAKDSPTITFTPYFAS